MTGAAWPLPFLAGRSALLRAPCGPLCVLPQRPSWVARGALASIASAIAVRRAAASAWPVQRTFFLALPPPEPAAFLAPAFGSSFLASFLGGLATAGHVRRQTAATGGLALLSGAASSASTGAVGWREGCASAHDVPTSVGDVAAGGPTT